MRHTMIAALAAAGVLATANVALANGGGKCFDKATLSYVDCPSAIDWSGWYLGAHVGYAWSDVEGDYGAYQYDDLDLDGLLAGGQIGFQQQLDNDIVIGLEIDASAIWADDDIPDDGNADVAIAAELDWVASARLRLGLAADEFMPYITGGVAWVGWEADGINTGGGAVATINVDESTIGGVVGGGLEYMLDENWIAGVEGLYYFFDDSEDISAASGTAGHEVGVNDMFTVRARLSYKF